MAGPTRPRRRARRIAVINQKGGSTKTTTALHLAAGLAHKGRRVRLHDLDPQLGGVTFWIPPVDEVGEGAFDVFTDERTLDQATSRTYIPGLYLVPSWESLRDVEQKPMPGSEVAYKQAIADSESDLDYEIYDCTHSLSTLAIAGVAAAEELIIPAQASGLDTAGMTALFKMYQTVKKRLTPELEIAGIVVGRTKNTSFDRQLLEGFRADYPKSVVVDVADSVRMREASDQHLTIFDYEPDGRAARDLTNLAALIDEWEMAA